MNFKELIEKTKIDMDKALESLANTGVSDVLKCKNNFNLNVCNKVDAILLHRNNDEDNFDEIGEKLNNIVDQFSEILDDFIEENKIDFRYNK